MSLSNINKHSKSGEVWRFEILTLRLRDNYTLTDVMLLKQSTAVSLLSRILMLAKGLDFLPHFCIQTLFHIIYNHNFLGLINQYKKWMYTYNTKFGINMRHMTYCMCLIACIQHVFMFFFPFS